MTDDGRIESPQLLSISSYICTMYYDHTDTGYERQSHQTKANCLIFRTIIHVSYMTVPNVIYKNV